MSLNYNKVMLAGRLTAAPELRTTPSGINVSTFNIAVDRDYKSENGEKQTDFIRCIAWRQTCDFISTYFTKGSAIFVEGALQTRSWNDRNGKRCFATEVVVNRASFVENKRDEGGNVGYQRQYQDDVQPDMQSFAEIEDADLPF